MARALIRNQTNTISAETLHLTLLVTYYGGGMPAGRPTDDSQVFVAVNGGMTKASARAAIRVAIKAEADRLGYPFPDNAVILTVEELLASV